MKKQILFGYGKNGKSVANEFEKKDFTIVVFSEEEKKDAQNDGYLNVEFLSTDILDEELIEIGIENVEVAICVLENEARNLFLSLSIRNLNKNIKIIAKSEDKDYIHRYRLAGVNKIISPYDIVAKRIDTILRKPVTIDIINSIVFEDTDLYFSQIDIIEHSFLDGKILSEIELEQEYNLVIVGIIDKEKSNKLQFLGNYDYKLDGGDTLVVIGPSSELERIKNEMEVSTKWHSQ
jgi:Trk K+ transport system NAD-binding subunit